MKLLEASDTDFGPHLAPLRVDQSRLAAELTRSLDKLKSGNARTPAISPSSLKMLTRGLDDRLARLTAPSQVRTGFTILALATDEELARIVRDVSKEFQKIEPEALSKDFVAIVAESREDEAPAAAAAAGAAEGAQPRRRAARRQPRPVHRQPDGERRKRQDRPGAGARFRNPPGGRHPHAPPPEQPHPDGRSGRGQDRRGGRFRAAHRAGRRAAGR